MTHGFHLFLPQMRMSLDEIVDRAVAAEAAGFEGIALMDHLAPPMAETQDMWDAMVTATWLLARTERLRVGHLVLCDSFRHPAVLARQAVTLDHASGGRFELGLGWGSVPTELETFGIGSAAARDRVDRLGETLEVIDALWSGERVEYAGTHHRIVGGLQRPTPTRPIPIVIGGAGPRTLDLVARHADWWNCPMHRLDRLEEMRTRTGSARTSVQQIVAFIPPGADRLTLAEQARARFGMMGDGPIIGDGDELVSHFRGQHDQGVDRHYIWFADFAPPATLEAFGDEVISRLG